jgi:hypothetical protein
MPGFRETVDDVESRGDFGISEPDALGMGAVILHGLEAAAPAEAEAAERSFAPAPERPPER